MSARLATLQTLTETQTALGGHTREWTTVASLWVELRLGGTSATVLANAPPERVETAQAIARALPAATRGQRLALAGEAPWRIVVAMPASPTPGRQTLNLERQL